MFSAKDSRFGRPLARDRPVDGPNMSRAPEQGPPPTAPPLARFYRHKLELVVCGWFTSDVGIGASTTSAATGFSIS